MICLDAYNKAFSKLPEGAREAEVNAEVHNRVCVSVVNGEAADVQVSRKTELFIRVSGERTGYVYTQNVEDDAEALLVRAYENSLYSDETGPEPMNREALTEDFGVIPAECAADVLMKNTKTLCALLKQKIEDRLKAMGAEGTVAVSASLSAETFGFKTVNSYGLDVQSFRPLYLFDVAANLSCAQGQAAVSLAVQKKDMSLFDLDRISRNLAERLNWQISQKTGFVSGRYPVILSEEAVYTLFATAWQEFSGYKYVDGASVFGGMLGKQVASECLSITDYVSVEDTGLEIDCDAEGSISRDAKILENGVLKEVLQNTATAAALGCENTGNAGRRSLLFGNIATSLLVIPKNFCIEPGKASLQEMEEHMGDGILITEYMDIFHTLDISSGNFSAPCYGVRIQDGKETERFTALTVSGNIRDLLSEVEEVGCDRFVRPMLMLENYGIGACALRVKGLQISGE